MKEKKNRPFIIRRSGWSAFSILAYLILGVALPAALIVVFFMTSNGTIDPPIQIASIDVASVCIFAGVLSLFSSFVIVCVAVHNARKTKYRFEGNVIIVENGKVFSDSEENKKFIFSPGMSVHMDQSVKGWFFRYGTVVITMGMSTAGEFRMEHVKRPNKVRKYIAKQLLQYSYTADYMSKPYISHPYAPANMFPHFFGGMFGMGMGMGHGCGGNGECGCGGTGCGHGAAYPYSSPYSMNGTSFPYNF